MSLPTLSDYLAAAKPRRPQQKRKSSSPPPIDQGVVDDSSKPTEDPSSRMGLAKLFEDAALPMPVHEPHLLTRATRAVVPLAVGSARFKGCFIEPNLVRTVWHGFGEPLRVGATYLTRFGDTAHPMVCTAFSSADVAEFAVADSFRVAVGAVVCSVQDLVPEKLVGFHFKGAEMFNQVDANTWVSSGRLLGPGDSGGPVLDDRGKWVLEFVGIRDADGARVFTRSSMGPSPMIGALIGSRLGVRGVTRHKKRGARRGAPRMSQADYEKRRAQAEAEAGRRLTARELNQIFFHQDEADSYIARKEAEEGGESDSYYERIEQYSDVYYVDHDADRDVYHQYVSDDDDRPVWQGDAESDESDYDAALGMSEAKFMATPAASLPPGQRGIHHGSDPDPKHPRLDDDDGDEDMQPPPIAPPGMPSLTLAPSVLAPAFVDAAMSEAWFSITDPKDQVELACELMCVPEVARGVYRKMPARAAIGALEAIYFKKKAPVVGPVPGAPSVVLSRPATKKTKAEDARQAEINALKEKKSQLEAEGFKLRDLVVLTEDERRKFPAPTHAAMLLRKQIKVLENARSAKKNFLKKMEEREALMARAQEKVEQLAQQLSDMQMHLEEYEDKQGMNFRE